MRTLLNIVWLVLAGLWLALGYAIAGMIWRDEDLLKEIPTNDCARDQGWRLSASAGARAAATLSARAYSRR